MPPGGRPAKLFINYRREDTAPYAGRLYDRLVAHFGEDQVFIDIDQIDPGEDFVEVINRKVGSCEIAIVAIGPNWLTATDSSGNRRLDDSEDFVRMEIVAALERKIRLIPVLVGGARMPPRHDLPEAIAALSRRNAIELSETRFHADVSRLIEAIEKPRVLPETQVMPPPVPVPVPVAPITHTVPPAKLADPESLVKTSVPPLLAGPDQPPNPPPVPKTRAPAAPPKKSKMPWILGGLGCFVSLLLVVFVVVASYIASHAPSVVDRSVSVSPQPIGYGTRLEYNGGELFYTPSVTESEAEKLGEYLVKSKFFAGKPYTVQLNKTGTTYEVRVCVIDGAENEDTTIAYYKKLGHDISLNVFAGRTVVVHLCDRNMKTLRVLTPNR